MTQSKNLAAYMAAAILEARNSVDFSRANYRAQTGDIIVEIYSPRGELVLEVDGYACITNNVPAHKAYLRILDEEFELSTVEKINLSKTVPDILRKAIERYRDRTAKHQLHE